MLELRWYQQAANEATVRYLNTHLAGSNPIVATPTATGKSVIQAAFYKWLLEQFPGTRIVAATHQKELIEQNYEKLLGIWKDAPAGIYSASVGRKEIAPITFAGIQTARNRAIDFGKVHIMTVDECHLVGNDQNSAYIKFINDLHVLNPAMRIVGYSATPYRLGMGMLTQGGIFTDICYNLTDRESFLRLISEGFLCPLISRKTDVELDVSDVHLSGGEFIPKELQDRIDRHPITAAALKETLQKSGDRKHWLVFAAGIEHAGHIADMLNMMGVPATVVHGELSKAERELRISLFRAGVYRAVVNNNVLTTGFDFPGIDLIVMLRPTFSPGLWVQMLGRGMRVDPSKTNCLVLDFARNTARLGPVNDPILPRAKGRRSLGGAPSLPPVRICPDCNTYNHASARVCESCGHEFPKIIAITQQASDQDVIAGLSQPVVVDFDVNSIRYSVHNKIGKPPSLKVTYQCGLRQFKEWICFEHQGYAAHRAQEWWRRRSNLPCPETTDEAFHLATMLPTPDKVSVWVNTTHPEIMAHKFEGVPA